MHENEISVSARDPEVLNFVARARYCLEENRSFGGFFLGLVEESAEVGFCKWGKCSLPQEFSSGYGSFRVESQCSPPFS